MKACAWKWQNFKEAILTFKTNRNQVINYKNHIELYVFLNQVKERVMNEVKERVGGGGVGILL